MNIPLALYLFDFIQCAHFVARLNNNSDSSHKDLLPKQKLLIYLVEVETTQEYFIS